MIKPDIIVSWPRNCDYPLWRDFIRSNRERFNLVIIVFTETHYGDDYRSFVRDAMLRDYTLFIDNPQIRGDEDWRDIAIHQGLIHSYNAEWIWFTEQDFIVKGGFWEELEIMDNVGDEVMATYDSSRMHPCNIFVKRETLNKTRKRFGIVKDVSDHFSIFQKELEENGARIGIFNDYTYEHLNGLSHNMKLIWEGNNPVWNKDRFDKYLLQSLNVPVPLDDRWKEIVLGYLNRQGL